MRDKIPATGFHTRSNRRAESRGKSRRNGFPEGTPAAVPRAGTLNTKMEVFLCADFLSVT